MDSPAPGSPAIELHTGEMAAGGGCVARHPDGRVVFVRHALPGELVLARVTGETSSYLRADAVVVLDPSPHRVESRCPHAGAGKCGGCDWQHVALPAQRSLKAGLVAQQLRRLAGIDLSVEVEPVAGDAAGLGWRTRVRFAVDADGRVGLRRHRSHSVVAVTHCPLAWSGVDEVGVGDHRWPGARQLEVAASPDGRVAVVHVDAGRRRLGRLPAVDAGIVVGRRVVRPPDRLLYKVLGRSFSVSAGVFWQVHPGGAAVLVEAVLAGAGIRPGDRVLDLYTGAGLFAAHLAEAVGAGGRVTAVERNARACDDAVANTADLPQVTMCRGQVTRELVTGGLGRPDVVVLDPARHGAGRDVMGALCDLRPPPRRMVSVSCDPATFARDLKVALDAGWSLASLRALDLFPMTEHVELVAVLVPPSSSGRSGQADRRG